MSKINLHDQLRQSKDKSMFESVGSKTNGTRNSLKCSYSTSIAQSSSNSLANISVSFMKDMNFPKLFDQTPMLFSFNPQSAKNSNSLTKSTSSSSGFNSGLRTSSASSSYSSFKGFFKNQSRDQTKSKSIFGRKQKDVTIDLSKKPNNTDKNNNRSSFTNLPSQHKYRNSTLGTSNRMTEQRKTLLTNPSDLITKQQNIKVFIRIKPTQQQQLYDGKMPELYIKRIDQKHLQMENKLMAYDYIFENQSEQSEVFTIVAMPVVDSVIDGYNGTIFAYGQTGSGKTHTMFGNLQCQANEGLIPRVIKELFIKKKQEDFIDVSLLQIYKQELIDLLTGSKKDLKIKQTSAGITVENLTRLSVTSSSQALTLIEQSEKNRRIASTKLNEKSSRSHTILTLYLKGQQTQTKLCLIDLAGSQKVNKAGVSGENLEQTKKINYSLSCLGNVINALITRKKTDHIPFRDSKLTRLLKDSLSGKFKTSIIVNCSSDPGTIEETSSSLKFADRAKKVKVTINKNNLKGKQNIEYLQMVIKKLTCDLEVTKKQLDKYKQICHEGKTREQSSDSMDSQMPPPAEHDQNMQSISEADITPRQAIPSQRANTEQIMKKYGKQNMLAFKHNPEKPKKKQIVSILVPHPTNTINLVSNKNTEKQKNGKSNKVVFVSNRNSRRKSQREVDAVGDEILGELKTDNQCVKNDRKIVPQLNLGELSSLNVSRSVANFFGQINSPSVSSLSIRQEDNTEDLSLNFSLQKSETQREKFEKLF